MTDSATILETVYGIDLSFDAHFGRRGTKDVVANGPDLAWTFGPAALAQELQRLFDLTPRGAFVDDVGYGIDWSAIGSRGLKPAIAITKLEVIRALQHPSFRDRCKLIYLDVFWRPETPTAIWINGVIELRGFADVPQVQFGPYGLNILTT